MGILINQSGFKWSVMFERCSDGERCLLGSKETLTLCWAMAQHFFLAMASIVLTMSWQNAKKNTAKLFPFNIADVNYVAHFDTKIQSLKDYLGALESDKELVSPFVAAHKITYGDDKEPQVENTEFLRI